MAITTAEQIAKQEALLADTEFTSTRSAEKLASVQSNIDLAKRRQALAGQVTSDAGELGDIESREFAIRSALATEGTGRRASSFFSGGVTINAPFGQQFELFEGGGVKVSDFRPPTPEEIEADKTRTRTSLFDQPTQGGQAVEGFQEEGISLVPQEGKTIVRSGQTIKNPSTGVDEEAKPGHILIEFDDGTVEERSIDSIQTPGETKPIGEFGRTPEELGITRRTEVKGGPGQEVTRAPFTASEAFEQAQTAEEKDQVLADEGLKPTSELELIGKSYQGRTAGEGMLFYQDPETRKILERPDSLKDLAQPSTSPTILASRRNILDMFQSVWGREPTPEEQEYWQSRTNKTGSELLGAMQFAKQQGGADEPGTDPASRIETMKINANAGQDKLASTYQEAGVTTGSSDKAARRAELDAIKAPEARSQQEFTQDQLASTQFQEAQNDLNKAKASLRLLDAGHISNLEDLEQQGGSIVALRRNQTELDIAYNRARARMVAEVGVRSDIVQSQSVIMGMMIDAFKFDTQQAQVEYTNRFNKAMSMYNLVATEERDAFNVQQKLQDNQRANLSVMTGMLADGAISYDQLTPDAKANIERMEQATGLVGVSRAIGKTPMPPVVSIGSPITAADGGVHTPIYSQDPKTGEVSVTNYTSPFKAKVTGGSGTGGVDLLAGLLNGALGDSSDWEFDKNEGDTILTPPPMNGIPGSKMKWGRDENGQELVWEADNKGNWT